MTETEAKNQAYLERNKLVALLASLFPSGIAKTAIEGWDEAWHGCVYIDFPWGQASWHYHDSQAHLFDHLPPYWGQWDGHTTEEKYAAIMAAVKTPPGNNYRRHALNEFRAAGWTDEHGKFNDEMQEAICNHVMRLLDAFNGEGHSGTSAPYAISLFEKLAKFEPIVPLTGEDWEWFDHGHCMQNKRCGRVFKQADRFNGQAYDIEGRVFYEWYTSEETGEKHKACFTNRDSFVPITFPYTPTTEYVERPSEAS